MLKWLVAKQPSNASDQVFTNDPFASLSRKEAAKSEIVYSVSRVNPLYEDEDGRLEVTALKNDFYKSDRRVITKRQLIPSSPPESPPTDRESVKSSGYGSKEADSVSYQSDSPDADDIPDLQLNQYKEDNTRSPPNFDSPGTVYELRKSFENLSDKKDDSPHPQFQVIHKDSSYVNAIEVDKEHPITHSKIVEDTVTEESLPNGGEQWPKVSHLAETLKRQAERISKRRAKEAATKKGVGQSTKSQILRFNPLVSVVAQDRRYVTAISVSPNSKTSQGPRSKSLHKSKLKQSVSLMPLDLEPDDYSVQSYFKAHNTSMYANEYPLLSLQPDSLVTEDTLKMMNYPNHSMKSRRSSSNSDYYEPNPSEDMPVFGKAIYSGFYSTALSETSNRSNYARSNASSSTHSAGVKKKGAFVVKDLWEKSGLKTNGRKFLVDVNELLQKSGELPESGRRVSDGNKVFSVSNYIGNNPHLYKSNTTGRPDSRRTSSNCDDNAYSIPTTDSSSNYEQVIDYRHGLDNSAFIDDAGRLRGTNFRNKPIFQHSLTNFQKKVTDRMLSEPSHRKSWVDLDNRAFGGSGVSNSNGISISREGTSSGQPSKSKRKHHPGKAIRELGLDQIEQKAAMGSYYMRPWNSSLNRHNGKSGQDMGNHDERKRYQFWDYNWKSSLKDASLSSFFSPHPNCGAIYERGTDVCHDFTLDAFKKHRLSTGRVKRKKRRRCLLVLLILVALLCFLGSIIGISWYLTNGERLFGAM